ncbi:hypothetical protein JT358_00895 [Micrococcales bacterium 31B]|nr:hypothetical protein [Micrococcales bacterium 31B]
MSRRTRTLGFYVIAVVLCLIIVLRPVTMGNAGPLVLQWMAYAALVMIALRGAAELFLKVRPDDKRENGGIVRPHDADENWPHRSK